MDSINSSIQSSVPIEQSLTTTSHKSQNTLQKLSVPSFSSFNPEYKDPNTKKRDLELQEYLDKQDKVEKRSKKKHKKDKKSKSRKDLNESLKEYCIDTNEVKLNLVYGTVHGSAIPEYSRQSNVIYGNQDWRMDFKASKGSRYAVIYSINTFGNQEKMSNVKRYQLFKDALKLRPTRVKKSLIESNKNDEFIALPGNILDIKGNTLDNDMDVDDFKLDSEYTLESKEIHSQLQSDPNDITLWLKLVRLQDKLVPGDAFGKKKKSRAILEKKLSIFEKALDHHPYDSRLIMGYMECYQQIHDTSSILNKWDDILYDNPHNYSLWKLYLEFRMAQYSSFTVSDCLMVFQECIEALFSDPDGNIYLKY